MKKIYRFICLFFTAWLLASCSGNNLSVGVEIQPDIDAINSVVDIFSVESRDVLAPPVSAQCDTTCMLLGNYYSSRYGGTKAELLVQFMPPEGYTFPSEAYNPVPDSLVMIMTYNGFTGSFNEPFELAVYEMNLGSIDYNQQYLSDLDVNEFCDRSILMGKQISTSLDLTLSTEELDAEDYQAYIYYKFSDEHLQRFFNMPRSVYESREAFLNEFKGVYITPTYGQSTMLYLREIYLQLYYHYTYQKNGVDTVVTTYITFPASHEVRQLNAISHPNREQYINKIDSLNIMKGVGGIYTEIDIPIGEMRRRINDSIGDKMLMMNSAVLSFEITDVELAARSMPMFSNLLLLPSDQVEEFVRTNTLPNTYDTTMVVGYYNITPQREYQFDLAYFLAKRIRSNPTDYDEVLKMTVMPIATTQSTTSSGTTGITAVRPMKQLSAASIRSSKNNYSPMRIEISYSGM
ncbi:MAG: DUF4270 domain-containing protein [Bacteroidales bacterium]|nr:DUF4270 domain-containing protein [Bacteroidales bacterium]